MPGVIERKIPWLIQPQYPVGIDWSNPLADGLVFDFSPAFIRDSLNTTNLTNNGTTDSVLASGRARQFVRASSQYINCGSPSWANFGGSNFSFEFVLQLNSAASGTTRMQVFSKDSASGRQVWVECNTTAEVDGRTNNSISLVWLNGASLVQCHTPVDSIVSGVRYHVILQRVGNSIEGYINGQAVTITMLSSAWADIATTTTDLLIGRRVYGGNEENIDGSIQLVRARNRALSARQVADTYANPWQIFPPINRRIWVASAGGVTGTISYTLASFTSSIVGTTTIVGNIAQTLADTTSTITGTTEDQGTIAVTLQNTTSSISGSPVDQGVISTTLQDNTSAISGSVGTAISGSISNTLDNTTNAITGTTGIVGNISSTLDNNTSGISGTTTIIGTIAVTLADAISSIYDSAASLVKRFLALLGVGS